MPVVSQEKLLWAYERMVLIRVFEDKLHQLIPQHRLPGFAHLSAGQEALAVGVCAHLDDQDFVVAFEADSAAEFLDLVQELRETESSKYTLRDTPMYTCRRSTVEEILDSLA